MLKRFFTSFPFLSTRIKFGLFAVCLVAALSLPGGFRTAISDSHQHVKNVGPLRVANLEGPAASQYLEHSSDGEALRSAVRLARYGITQGKSESHIAISHDQNLATEFGEQSLAVSSTNDEQGDANSWRLELQLKSIGYGKELLEAPGVLSRNVNGTRMEYQRVGLVEWYENGPDGIEQSFKILRRPSQPVAGNEPLRLALSVTGDLRARLKSEGTDIEFTNARGQHVLNYSKLAANDATGRTLAAHMETDANGKRIQLVVNDKDAVYPIVIDPFMWTHTRLVASDGGKGDYFGNSVAISGNTAVVGAVHDSYISGTPGVVYVFVRNDINWTQQARLRTNDVGAQGGQFGCSVSISGNTIVVGAKYMDVDQPAGTNRAQGAVYVFNRAGVTWSAPIRLTASDGRSLRYFGSTVAISGETVIVGSADNAAYVFASTAGAWSQQQKLTQSDAAPGSYFGYVVAISGETAIVSGGHNPLPTPAGETYGIGSVYVFVRSGTVWTQQDQLFQGDRILGDAFGSSIGISRNTAIVSYYNGRNNLEHPTRHGAYVFFRTGSTWALQAKITSGISQRADSRVGVGVDNDTAIVGYSGGYDRGPLEGSAYIFERQRRNLDGFGESSTTCRANSGRVRQQCGYQW